MGAAVRCLIGHAGVPTSHFAASPARFSIRRMADQGLRDQLSLAPHRTKPQRHLKQANQAHDSLRWLPRAILELQRAAGNAAVSELIAQRDDAHAVAAPARSTSLDEQARAIISAAQAETPGIEERAVNAVRAIIDSYYPDKKSMVKEVKWAATLDGLMTTAQGKGPKVTGVISVGEKFIVHTKSQHFARHVLQVGHELEHIQQHRDGLGGDKKKHEREFLAFYHEGTATELPHTGHMRPEMRIRLLDEAIQNYNALSDGDKRKYVDQYRDLLEQKARFQRRVSPE